MSIKDISFRLFPFLSCFGQLYWSARVIILFQHCSISWCYCGSNFPSSLGSCVSFQQRFYSSRRFSELLLKLIYFSRRKSIASLLFPLCLSFSLFRQIYLVCSKQSSPVSLFIASLFPLLSVRPRLSRKTLINTSFVWPLVTKLFRDAKFTNIYNIHGCLSPPRWAPVLVQLCKSDFLLFLAAD